VSVRRAKTELSRDARRRHSSVMPPTEDVAQRRFAAARAAQGGASDRH
jgi:hypothetical protein